MPTANPPDVHRIKFMDKIFGDRVSDLFGQKWSWFALFGAFMFFAYGAWVFSTPEYEIMFNHRTLPQVQTEKAIMHCHIFEIGNTGRQTQKFVNVIFSTNALSATALKPQVENFGKVTRKTETRTSGDTTKIYLGAVKPGKRVEIQLVFIYRKDETPLWWDEIFKGVEIAEGEATKGDPGWTTVGRMLYTVFG